ncbi:MAG: hypothetical protein KJ634_03180 [Gammaproteobacteria bacterium]|nr:hypothetical protein [Gammaproteobacteria bacterium]MBU1414605.1 hypothetical protein [Gammaproteobacteria bacterium]
MSGHVVVLRFKADNQATPERIQAEFKTTLETIWPGLHVTFTSGGHQEPDVFPGGSSGPLPPLPGVSPRLTFL